MTKGEAERILRRFDRLDEDELVRLPDESIEAYCRAIEVAFDGVCGRPPRREGRADAPARELSRAARHRPDAHASTTTISLRPRRGTLS